MAWPLAARGQQAPPPVIGILDSGSPDADGDRMRAYRKGLSETGYVDLLRPRNHASRARGIAQRVRCQRPWYNALYDFYRTPAGSRLASKLNTVSADLLPEVQTFMSRQFAPRVSARLSNDARLRNALQP